MRTFKARKFVGAINEDGKNIFSVDVVKGEERDANNGASGRLQYGGD
jgi:hypothetical protein